MYKYLPIEMQEKIEVIVNWLFDERYLFPNYMITESKDCYVIDGGHINIGEEKSEKLSKEIISTFWMEMINENIYERN